MVGGYYQIFVNIMIMNNKLVPSIWFAEIDTPLSHWYDSRLPIRVGPWKERRGINHIDWHLLCCIIGSYYYYDATRDKIGSDTVVPSRRRIACCGRCVGGRGWLCKLRDDFEWERRKLGTPPPTKLVLIASVRYRGWLTMLIRRIVNVLEKFTSMSKQLADGFDNKWLAGNGGAYLLISSFVDR